MYQPEGEGRARARRIISGAGYKCGGHFAKGGGIRADEIADKLEITKAIHEHEGALHPGSKKTRLRLADGGIAGGGIPMGRADRPSRGKKPGGGKTHVNILIAPQGDKAGTEGPPPGGPPPGGPPMGPPPGPMGGPPRPPPPPMAPPPGMPPMGVGAPGGGAPPMMRKAGGRAGRRLAEGGDAKDDDKRLPGKDDPAYRPHSPESDPNWKWKNPLGWSRIKEPGNIGSKAGGRAGRRRLADGGGADSEGMQMGGMPQGQVPMPLPPAQGGGLRRAQGLGPPGWPGNPTPGMPPGGGMPPAAMPLPPAQGGGLNRAMGIGPPGWPGNPSAGAPSMGAPAGGPSSALGGPPPGGGTGIPAGYNPNANIMSMAAPDRMAAMGYGSGAPSPQQMQAMGNTGGLTPMARNVPTGPAPQMPANMPTPPAMQPPAAPRKRGGRAGLAAGGRYSPPDMEAGAGSGEGRLQKIGKDY